MNLRIRFAGPNDAETIHRFIVALADYEREPGAVSCTADNLRRQLSSARPPFECLLAEVDGKPVGFALFFHTYSTWRGKQGIFLEDLFVPPQYRGRGVGKRLLIELARIAVERDCPRLEWSVLDWNASAISFYESLGARALPEWIHYRLTDAPLAALGNEGKMGAW